MNRKFCKFNFSFLLKILLIILIFFLVFKLFFKTLIKHDLSSLIMSNLNQSLRYSKNGVKLASPSSECNFFTCFNVYQCGNNGDRLLVYIYPQEKIEDFDKNLLSKEFYTILKTIISSKYYTRNINDACLIIFSSDMLHSLKKKKIVTQSSKEFQL